MLDMKAAGLSEMSTNPYQTARRQCSGPDTQRADNVKSQVIILCHLLVAFCNYKTVCNQLTPWSRVPEKLIVTQLVKKLYPYLGPTFHYRTHNSFLFYSFKALLIYTADPVAALGFRLS
jgi:hypothetical protein